MSTLHLLTRRLGADQLAEIRPLVADDEPLVLVADASYQYGLAVQLGFKVFAVNDEIKARGIDAMVPSDRILSMQQWVELSIRADRVLSW